LPGGDVLGDTVGGTVGEIISEEIASIAPHKTSKK
jgi:hypothetical protein